MIFKIALKNFLRQGMRALLNVLITALTMVAVVFNLSLYNGFLDQAISNMVSTDVAGGHYRTPEFDLLSPTEWEDQTFKPSDILSSLPPSDKAEVLLLQGQIVPNDDGNDVINGSNPFLQFAEREVEKSLVHLHATQLHWKQAAIGENLALKKQHFRFIGWRQR